MISRSFEFFALCVLLFISFYRFNSPCFVFSFWLKTSLDLDIDEVYFFSFVQLSAFIHLIWHNIFVSTTKFFSFSFFFFSSSTSCFFDRVTSCMRTIRSSVTVSFFFFRLFSPSLSL